MWGVCGGRRKERIIIDEELRTDSQICPQCHHLYTLTSPVQVLPLIYSYLRALSRALRKLPFLKDRVIGAEYLDMAVPLTPGDLIFPLDSFLPVTIAEHLL